MILCIMVSEMVHIRLSKMAQFILNAFVLIGTTLQPNLITLPETNVAPETLGLEDEFPFEKAS